MGKPILITVFILGLAAMLPNQALAKADPTLDQDWGNVCRASDKYGGRYIQWRH